MKSSYCHLIPITLTKNLTLFIVLFIFSLKSSLVKIMFGLQSSIILVNSFEEYLSFKPTYIIPAFCIPNRVITLSKEFFNRTATLSAFCKPCFINAFAN